VHIVIAGGTGFLGRALAARLTARGDRVAVLTRRPTALAELGWDPAAPDGAWVQAVQTADAVVNLAGESISAARWTPARKTALRDSRLKATGALARVVSSAARPPVLISASGIGYYGTPGDTLLTEQDPPGGDYLARLCVEWEAAALGAAERARVILLRTGVVLARNGGALTELARPFQFFAGGPIGSGQQFVSWIHLDDWVGMTVWAIDTAAVAGPLNLTAPEPVRNADMARELGRAMGRPSLLRAPAFAVRLVAGEMADAAILNGQRVLPAKAQALGYRFLFPDLRGALDQIFNRTGARS
jgi:hypothetical protein